MKSEAVTHLTCLPLISGNTGADDFCKDYTQANAVAAKPVLKVSEVVYIEQYDEEAVLEALYKYGPLSIGVDAEPIPFRFYSTGVLDTPECSSKPEHIDHAILLVGYGTEEGTSFMPSETRAQVVTTLYFDC
jgi:hypothetical protein